MRHRSSTRTAAVPLTLQGDFYTFSIRLLDIGRQLPEHASGSAPSGDGQAQSWANGKAVIEDGKIIGQRGGQSSNLMLTI